MHVYPIVKARSVELESMSRLVTRAFEVSRPWASRFTTARCVWRSIPEDAGSVASLPSGSGSRRWGVNPNASWNLRGFAVGREKLQDGPGLEHFINRNDDINDQVRRWENAHDVSPQ